jgi:2-polyprenyl-6-methoxyphenol hydroxylase-like FAD-dependent oxidoreductase
VTEDIVIIGAGPNGLMLAAELALAGVRPLVLEQRATPGDIPKANGLVGQIVRFLAARGLLDRFADGATYAGPVPRFRFGSVPVDLGPDSPLHILAVPQRRLEQLLDERATELGARIQRGHRLVTFTQDDDGVTLDVTGPDGDYRLRARYVVGCDGAHSLVRTTAGIAFPGHTSDKVVRIGRVTLADVRDLPAHSACTVVPLSTLDKEAAPNTYIVSTHEPGPEPEAPMTLDELADSVRRVTGVELAMSEPQWLSRTVANSRLAQRFRAGRVFLVGDAAHLFNAGGTGLNAGMLDAANLAWKLAAEIDGRAAPGLLDTYHTERHAAGERTILQTRAQAALGADGPNAEALRELFAELMTYREPLRHIGETLQGGDDRQWAFDLDMSRARPVLVDATGTAAKIAADWQDRIDIRPGERTMLVRPDCFIAWDGDDTAGLTTALESMFTRVPR